MGVIEQLIENAIKEMFEVDKKALEDIRNLANEQREAIKEYGRISKRPLVVPSN